MHSLSSFHSFITAKRACKPNISSPTLAQLFIFIRLLFLFLFGFRSFAIVLLCYHYYLLSRRFRYSICSANFLILMYISRAFFFLCSFLHPVFVFFFKKKGSYSDTRIVVPFLIDLMFFCLLSFLSHHPITCLLIFFLLLLLCAE